MDADVPVNDADVPVNMERALGDLRRELHAAGIPTEDRDVFWMRSGDPMLSLAPGLVVWVGSEWFRWIGDRLRWRWHTVHDPAGRSGSSSWSTEAARRDPPERTPPSLGEALLSEGL